MRASIVGICLAILLLAPASAVGEVLVSAPLSHECLGHSIAVGVWYKPTDLSRSFRVEIFDPAGRLVFARAGLATSVWRSWSYVPRRTGIFHTVYYLRQRSFSFDTRVAASGCFSGNVAGLGSGPGHNFHVGDGLYLNFLDRVSYGTPYRVCWQRVDGVNRRCWSWRASASNHSDRLFAVAPNRVGRYIVRWYVRGDLAATWTFLNGPGD